jgi:sortase (surface protein transpeptidase)
VLLGIAFVTLLVEPTQASAPPGAERIAANAVLDLPDDRPARPARDHGPAPASFDEAAEAAAAPSEAAVAATAPLVLDGMRVRVARLGIDLPLLRGDTVRDTVLRSTPNGAAFLLPSSAPPGSGGNSYVYAHARQGMFLSLWDVRLGDVVEVTAPSNEVRRYVVTEIHPSVVPTDVRHTLPTGDERITLQTSTGARDADPRFVVVAVRGR